MAKEPKPKTAGPNLYPEARTDAQRAALTVTCQYLGRVYYEGDTICYRHKAWVCTGGSWAPTGADC